MRRWSYARTSTATVRRDDLGRGSVRGEPCAPDSPKHGRVQDASKRLDRDQIWSREPGDGAHVYSPVETVPAPGRRQCRADEPMYRGIADLGQRLAGKLIQREERTNGSAGGNFRGAAVAFRQPRQQRV